MASPYRYIIALLAEAIASTPCAAIAARNTNKPTQSDCMTMPMHLATNEGIHVFRKTEEPKVRECGDLVLLQNFVLREKVFHLNQERIVHTGGSAAHGYFEATDDISHISKTAPFGK